MQDFRLYHLGAQSILLRHNPYTEVQGVIYPPISLALLTPFATLPVALAEDVWTVLSLMALLVSILLLLKITKTCSTRNFFLLTGLAMLSFPVKFNLGMGQINLFLLLLVCLSFYWYRKQLPELAGSALAFAAALKLTPLVLLLFFLKKRQWRVVMSCLVGFGLLNGLGVLLLGTAVTTDYWQKIFPAIPTVGNAVYYNQALTGWLARAQVIDSLAQVINYLVFGGLIVTSCFFTRTKRHSASMELSELGLLMIAVLAGTGLAWQHHYVALLVPFFSLVLIATKLKRSKTVYLTAIGVSYLLVAANIKNPLAIQGLWQQFVLSHVLIGAIILFAVTVFRLRLSTRKTNTK